MQELLKQQRVQSEASKDLKAGNLFTAYFASGSTYSGYVLAHESEYICYMNGIGGRLKSTGDPHFFMGSNDVTGNIYAYKPQTAGFAYATCVPRTSFSSPGGFSPFSTHYGYNFIWDGQPYGCGQRVTWNTGYKGDYAAMMSGLGYDYNHASDKFAIVQSSRTDTSSQAWLEQTAAPCRGVGFTTSVRLHSDGFPAKFRGPGGIGSAATAGEWYYPVTGGSFNVDLGVPFSSNSCYFTFMAGNFSSDNEYALLTTYNGKWRLFMSAVSNGGIRGSVRCIPHAQ